MHTTVCVKMTHYVVMLMEAAFVRQVGRAMNAISLVIAHYMALDAIKYVDVRMVLRAVI